MHGPRGSDRQRLGGNVTGLIAQDPELSRKWNQRTRVVQLAAAHRLPTLYAEREFVNAGGFMSYGPSVPGNFRRAAAYVDKILKSANPVEQPMTSELVINLRTAQALGLTIPSSLLFQADEVIR
jgi:putative ABC transport system substrate-binding protein